MVKLAELSLRNRALIALVTVTIAIFGTLAMNSLKQELIPSVTLPVVSVVTSYPGAAPEIVDEDVSKPVESAMQGLEGLESTTATSSSNISTVSVQFTYGTDLVYAQQRIQQAINRIESTLPDSATTSILSGSIDDFPVMQIAVTGGDAATTANLVRLQTLGDLADIPGVRDASLDGAPTPRIAITPDPALAAPLGVTSETFRDTLEASGVLIPIGQLTEGDETLTVQAGSLLTSAADVAALPLQGITRGGQPVTIDEVATVVQDDEPVASISRVNGVDALTISVTKRPDANTVEVSQAIRAALPDLQAQLGGDVQLQTVFDQAPFIEQSIETLIVEGLLGLVMAVIVIFVFLLSFRATIVTAISIPTSLLVTFIGLQAADYSLNILTLGALTIAIGRVVDDSIVVIENIKRHMGLHPAATRRGEERAVIIGGAVKEVAGAVTASTIATVAVYLPIAFVGDISGELFRPFALTSAIALLASLVVSLTIVPVLAYWMLRGGKLRTKRAGDPELLPTGPRTGVDPATATAAGPEGPEAAAAAAPTGDGNGDRRARPREERAKADLAVFAPLSLRDESADALTEETASRDEVLRAAAEAAATREPETRDPETGAIRTPVVTDDAEPTHAWVAGPTVDGEPVVTGEGVTPPSRRELRRLREARAGGANARGADDATTGRIVLRAGEADEPTIRPADEAAIAPVTAASVVEADADAEEHEPSSWLQRVYEPVLRWTLRHPAVTLVAAVLVLVLTGVLAPFMQTNYLGDTGQNTFSVTQTVDPSSSLDARDRAARAVEDVLVATPGVETVQLSIQAGAGGGFAAVFGGGGGAATARFSVTLASDVDPNEVQDAVRADLESRTDVGEISIGGDSSGFSSDLAVDVQAPTTEALREATTQVADAMRGVEGISEVSNSLDESRPFVQLDVDQAAAAQAGVSELVIGGIVAQRMTPVEVGDVAIDGSTVTVYVVGEAPPTSLEELRALQIPTALGQRPLSDFATVEITDGPVAITSEGGTPTASVTIVPQSDDLTSANALVQERLDGLTLPDGATAELGGVSTDQAVAFQQLGLALLIAILIVYIVMVATFKSLLQPLLLLVSVPFAATGAILLQVVTGVPLGVASLIGVLMLIGIVVTNAIVLIDLVNQFRARGRDVRDAVMHGGSRRVRPILMTALATILALTPMALGVTGHSGFISQPLAIVVIGGLLSSTVLTLLVLPALYAVVEGPIERRRERRAARAEAQLRAAGLD